MMQVDSRMDHPMALGRSCGLSRNDCIDFGEMRSIHAIYAAFACCIVATGRREGTCISHCTGVISESGVMLVGEAGRSRL
jgi:hypothetical protein